MLAACAPPAMASTATPRQIGPFLCVVALPSLIRRFPAGSAPRVTREGGRSATARAPARAGFPAATLTRRQIAGRMVAPRPRLA